MKTQVTAKKAPIKPAAKASTQAVPVKKVAPARLPKEEIRIEQRAAGWVWYFYRGGRLTCSSPANSLRRNALRSAEKFNGLLTRPVKIEG